MRIAAVCNDTRGGVQPYAALSEGLHRAGHHVRMVAPEDFASMIAELGLPFTPLSGSVEAMLRGTGGLSERGTLASMRFAAREMTTRLHTWTSEALAACEGVDVITGGVGGMVVALSVAEKLGVPFIETHLQPLGAPTDAYPGVLTAGIPRWLGKRAMRAGHRLSELAVWMPFKRAMASARTTVLGLAPGRPSAADRQPVLYGFSREVVPLPSEGRRARHVTGYWTRDLTDWIPPPRLAAMLAGSVPVVSVGFGSMVNQDPAATTALVLGAARDAGVRVVLLAGWDPVDRVGDHDDVFHADAIPHDWLFPRVRAVVHHGGAGTTGAALSAGVPAIVVPFAMDQPFWASRVVALGVGPTPIPRGRLTRGDLARALRATVTDEAMSSRAALLGARIRSEDGIHAAVEHFNRLA